MPTIRIFIGGLPPATIRRSHSRPMR